MNAIHKFFGRSGGLVALTVLGFVLLELLVQFGGDNASNGINGRWPELYVIIRAFAIMTWCEVLILWIRKLTQPLIDIQASVKKADDDPMAAAVLYGIHTVYWIVRVFVFYALTGLATVNLFAGTPSP